MDTYDYIQDREQLGKQLVSLVVTNHPGSRQTDKEEEMEKKNCMYKWIVSENSLSKTKTNWYFWCRNEFFLVSMFVQW